MVGTAPLGPSVHRIHWNILAHARVFVLKWESPQDSAVLIVDPNTVCTAYTASLSLYIYISLSLSQAD